MSNEQFPTNYDKTIIRKGWGEANIEYGYLFS